MAREKKMTKQEMIDAVCAFVDLYGYDQSKESLRKRDARLFAGAEVLTRVCFERCLSHIYLLGFYDAFYSGVTPTDKEDSGKDMPF